MTDESLLILLVEDNADHAEIIRRAFEDSTSNDKLTICQDLTAARQFLDKNIPDILIADLNLPDGKGTELIGSSSSDNPYPVILMTSYGDEKTVAEVMKCGAFDYLVKSQEVFLDLPRILTRSLREWTLKHEQITLLNETKAIYDLSIDMICIADLKGYFRRLNPSFQRILGYTDEELCDKPFIEFVHPDDQASTINAVSDLAKGMPVISFQNRYGTKTGEYRSLEWNASLSPQGDLIYAVARDITERIENEKETDKMREQLAQATKMESIGHLTAGIAHDFNNMLAAIMGYTELSMQMNETGNTEAVSQYQEEILKAGNRAKELISQMLTFSRLPLEVKGKDAPVIVLSPIVKEVVSLLRSSIPSTVELNYNIENNDLKARIQPVNLHQILLNLGVNAKDAIGEYGNIEICLSKRNIEDALCSSCKLACPGEYVQISVKDSGSGIPQQQLSKIFDPFFTTKEVGKGTGMGLSVVHGLIHSMNGHILTETNAEGGSIFNILLPLVSTNVASLAAVKTTPVANIKGLRIMVVDDEPVLVDLLQEFLSVYGADIVTFNSPQRALEFFIQQTEDIDLVITDESMPGMSGMLLAVNMLKVKPALPIILCTGYSEHATAESTAKIGIAGFFHKPVNMNELMLKIQVLGKPRS